MSARNWNVIWDSGVTLLPDKIIIPPVDNPIAIPINPPVGIP